MKKLIFIMLFCLSQAALALEVMGVKLDNYIQIGNHRVVINGAGMRFKYFVREYVAALYLPVRTPSVEVAMADLGAKRMLFHMLSDQNAKQLLDSIIESIRANHTAAEMQALQARLDEFSKAFKSVNQIKTGEEIIFDYLPGTGTTITIAGVAKGNIAGADFNRALLSIWIGENPVQRDLKISLLGID